MIEIKPVTPNEWDRFVDRRTEALPFHTSAWLNLLSRIYMLEWDRLGAWQESTLVGIIPLMYRKLGPFRLCGSPLMKSIASTPYMAPLSDPEMQAPIIEALYPFLLSRRVDHIEIAFPGMIAGTERLASLGYTLQVCHKVILELNDHTIDQLWSGLDDACRRAIRKAVSSGVRIIECHDASFIDEFYCMAQEVYCKAGREPHISKSFYEQLWDNLANTGMVRIYLAAQGDNVLAGGIFITYKGTVYYLSGVSYDIGLALRPNNLLQWRLIEWATENQYKFYDLGGSVIPGITRFKLSFGGQLVPFLRIYRANSWIAHIGRKGYQLTIPLWRRLEAMYHS
jgi:hypothetical protein